MLIIQTKKGVANFSERCNTLLTHGKTKQNEQFIKR